MIAVCIRLSGLLPVMSVFCGVCSPALCGPVDAQSNLRESVACGPHSVYILLRLMGVNIDYSDVFDATEVSAKGFSLTQMASECQRHGLDVSIRKVDLDEMRDHSSAPLIACIRPKTDIDRTQHFVVVMAVQVDGLLVLDGTTGEVRQLNFESLRSHYWTGYVLQPSKRSHDLLLFTSGVIALSVATAFVAMMRIQVHE